MIASRCNHIRRVRTAATMVGLLVGLSALSSCRRQPPEESAEPPAAGTPKEVTFTAAQIAHGGVRWSAVSAAAVADFTELPGRLVVDEDRTARISPAVTGRVLDVRANVGDAVTRGQILLTLQSEEGSARRADLAKATPELAERQSALNYARSMRERAERLLALKAGSAQDVERARTDETAAQSAVAQAQAAVDHARTALSVLDVDAETGQIQIRSPVAGVVVARDAVAGTVVQAGASALVVSDPSTLWLEFSAPDQIANALKPGQRIPFVVPSVATPLEARVLRVSGAVDPSTRLVTVRASVANPGRTLRPEMFATVRAETSPARPAITVPMDAVQLLDERPVVFVARPDGNGGATFSRRAVQTGATAEGRTHIVSGLQTGDVVVTDGAFAVKSAFSRAKMPSGG